MDGVVIPAFIFTDDVLLVATSPAQAQVMLDELAVALLKGGTHLYASKGSWAADSHVTNENESILRLAEMAVPLVSSFTFQGCEFHMTALTRWLRSWYISISKRLKLW